MEANSMIIMNPDQTAPKVAVPSGSILFAITATAVHQHMRKERTFVMNG